MDLHALDKLQPYVFLDPIEDKTPNQGLKTIWSKNGDNLVSFREIGYAQGGISNTLNVYFTAISRKSGANTGLPVLIKITDNTFEINLLKPGNVGVTVSQYNSVGGIAYIKNSFR